VQAIQVEIWADCSQVYISDLTLLYTLVLNLALSVRAGNNTRPETFENFYFGSVGEHAWGHVAKKIGLVLFERGKVERAEARSVKAGEDS
jgi:hypothetical protein